MTPTLGFIGAGKVGGALARLCARAGYDVRAVHSRTVVNAHKLAADVGAVVVDDPLRVVTMTDLTLLTIPDDAIAPLAQELAPGDLTGKAVIHTSGSRDAGVLAPLADAGAWVGGLHPAYPFVGQMPADLADVTFAVEAEAEILRGWLVELVNALQGRVLIVPPGQKALYHAALVFASNYTVTLYAIAQDLLLSLGADETTARQALNPLVGGTVENLRVQGIPDALPGPLVRGDVRTIAAHLDALRSRPDLYDAYRMLARLTFPLLTARGVTPPEHLFRQDES